MDKRSLRYSKDFKEKVLQGVLTGKLSCSSLRFLDGHDGI